MSTREALIQEILKQPEPLLREIRQYVAFLAKQQESETKGTSSLPAAAWPADYFQKTAGAFADEPLERPPQLPFQNREDW
jgi:hypothetical protein